MSDHEQPAASPHPPMTRDEWIEARFGEGRCACAQCWQYAANQYRIEADRAMSDYDALELDAGIMAGALVKIEQGRPNRTYDPWAQEVARKALLEVSSRVTDTLADLSHDRETISGG